MSHRPQSERGIALIMVLLVITLMMILVLEFTYTVQVETHISRNSLNSVQATYLARSGINILAGALLQDADPKIDPGDGDLWGQYTVGGCRNLLEGEESIPPTWLLCGRIVDESAKLNINLTRPQAVPTPGATVTHQCKPNGTPENFCWGDVLEHLAGLDDGMIEQLDEYWVNAMQATQPNGQPFEFSSLEDATALFPTLLVDRSLFDNLRKSVTALPISGRPQFRKLNINTIRQDVLAQVLTVFGGGQKGDAAQIKQACNATSFCDQAKLAAAFAGNPAARLFGVQTLSGVFRLEASAVVNGVAKTVRALVQRVQGPPIPNGPPGAVSWRLTYLDWQKESGASVTHETGDDDGGSLDGADNSGNNLS